METMLLQDLVQLCREQGTEPEVLLTLQPGQDPLTALLNQSIALRESGDAQLSLQLLDRAWQGGVRRGWLQDNRARALVALGRSDEALAIWADLSSEAVDATLQVFARTALNQLSWPPELLAAL